MSYLDNNESRPGNFNRETYDAQQAELKKCRAREAWIARRNRQENAGKLISRFERVYKIKFDDYCSEQARAAKKGSRIPQEGN